MLQKELLHGYRVLDLTRILAGPFCTMLLGDLGAEVIKIEPLGGDPTRKWGPPFYSSGDHSALYFHAFNRNKKSVSIDLSNPASHKIMHDLIKVSDVFVENFIPSSSKKYKLDFYTVNALNKDLVYCSISGYGQRGPFHRVPGYDLIVAAHGGLLSFTGPEEHPDEADSHMDTTGEPCRVGVAVTDLSTGLLAKSCILAALVPRRGQSSITIPRGCHIDVNLLSTQIALNSHVAANYLTAGIEPHRMGTSHPNLVPYRAYLTSDQRHLLIGTGSDAQFVILCQLIERPDLPKDAQFKTNADRVRNRSLTDSLIGKEIGSKPLTYWLDLLAGSGLPHGPVNKMSEVFASPQVQYYADRLVQSWPAEAEGPETIQSPPLRVPGPPFEFHFPTTSTSKRSDMYKTSPPPKLAQHTGQVLSELLNYSSQDINKLAAEGAIRLTEG